MLCALPTQESEMPIEELLAAYRRQYSSPEQSRSSSEEEILSNQDLTLDKEQIGELIIIANFGGTSVFFLLFICF